MKYYLLDMESDFSVFHRVDDIYSLAPARFFQLAYRITAYDGMVTKRLTAQREMAQHPGLAPSAGTPVSARRPAGQARPAVVTKRANNANASVVPAAAMALQFPGLIEQTKATPATSE